MKSGAELQIEAVDAVTNKPIAGALFWMMADQQRPRHEHILASTFWSGQAPTNASGSLRAILKPEPGKRSRFEFAGINEPNSPGSPVAESYKRQYLSKPTVSEPVELVGGKTNRLRFVFRKEK